MFVYLDVYDYPLDVDDLINRICYLICFNVFDWGQVKLPKYDYLAI